jgi:lysophospholipase L1-like esterase
MKRKSRFVVLFSMMVALGSAAACGAPPPTATTAPTPEPTAAPADTPPAPAEANAGITVTFPIGVFAAKDGAWIFRFDDDGTFTWSESGEVVASGTFSIQGNELTWETDSYCGNAASMKATYTWAFENDTLEFQVKGKDKCTDRQAAVDNVPYQREVWDLVVIGDSSLWGLADAFAAQIEADVGVKVVSHDATVGGLSAGTVLAALHSEGPPSTRLEKELADDLRQAEVVVMFANPEDSMDAEKLKDLESCISASAPKSPKNPAESCSLEAFEGYTVDLAAIWAQILELRDGQPTVLRATDIYNPVVSPWKESGAFEACTQCWEAMSQAARLAAEAYDIPFLSRYDAYNGRNHDKDPREKGYIVSDGEHPSHLMNQHTAELLSEMGYEPLISGPRAAPGAENAAAAVAESGDTTWDMVVLGDSLVADDYSTLPEAYAARIKEDLGVEVEIQNLAVGGETTRSLLTNVQKYPWYREPLQEAEIVLISVGGGDLPRMENRFFRDNDCGGADNQDCLRQQLEESQAEWDALLDEISSLADPGETLIRPIIPRILEYYARVYTDQPEEVAAYNSYVVALYEHMAESCAERGLRVLDLYALYDGPDANPSLPDIADRGDGVHVGDEGDAVIAELLSEMGYEPLIIGPAAVPGAKNAATAIAESGDTTWTYVALGDSVTWGMIPLYAEMLEEDLGVTVIVQDRTVGGDHSSQLLERLRTSNWLRKELGEADVITIEIPWNVFENPCLAFLNGSPGACGGSDNQDCLREALETYKADTDAIIAEIVSLRSPSEALIRMQDTYQFNVRQSKAEGAFETINKYWREANAHVKEVAEYYHIPVARVYDAFMGEDGSDDPQDKGLIHDGFHTSPEGAALMAELFRDLGYEYAVSEP